MVAGVSPAPCAASSICSCFFERMVYICSDKAAGPEWRRSRFPPAWPQIQQSAYGIPMQCHVGCIFQSMSELIFLRHIHLSDCFFACVGLPPLCVGSPVECRWSRRLLVFCGLRGRQCQCELPAFPRDGRVPAEQQLPRLRLYRALRPASTEAAFLPPGSLTN